jgi:exodeoxyribonuclease VII small subunit
MATKRFEDSLKRLEDIVKKLEEGDLSLEESLKLFEEGIKLSRLCTRQLEEAEKKVEILLKGGGKEFETRPFMAEDETAAHEE